MRPLGVRRTRTKIAGHQRCDVCHPTDEACRSRDKAAARKQEAIDASDDGPEPWPLASCGDPSCGDRCAHFDDPWCTENGDLIKPDGSLQFDPAEYDWQTDPKNIFR